MDFHLVQNYFLNGQNLHKDLKYIWLIAIENFQTYLDNHYSVADLFLVSHEHQHQNSLIILLSKMQEFIR